jgi:TolA-binding protein
VLKGVLFFIIFFSFLLGEGVILAEVTSAKEAEIKEAEIEALREKLKREKYKLKEIYQKIYEERRRINILLEELKTLTRLVKEKTTKEFIFLQKKLLKKGLSKEEIEKVVEEEKKKILRLWDKIFQELVDLQIRAEERGDDVLVGEILKAVKAVKESLGITFTPYLSKRLIRKNARILERKAIYYYNRRKYRVAIGFLYRILILYPTYPKIANVYFLLGESLYTIGYLEEAVKKYSKLRAEYPRFKYLPDALLALQEIEYGRKNYEKALSHYEFLLRRGGPSRILAPAHYIGALCYYWLGEYHRILRIVPKISRWNFYYGPIQYLGGLASLQLDKIAEAGSYFKRVILFLSPRHTLFKNLISLSHLKLAHLFDYLNRLDDAYSQYQQIPPTDQEFYDDALFGIAWLFIKIEDWENAIKTLDALIEKRPQSELILEAKILKAHLFLKQKKYEEALKFFRRLKTLISQRWVEVKTIEELLENIKNEKAVVSQLLLTISPLLYQTEEKRYSRVYRELLSYYKRIAEVKETLLEKELELNKEKKLLQKQLKDFNEWVEVGICIVFYLRKNWYNEKILEVSKDFSRQISALQRKFKDEAKIKAEFERLERAYNRRVLELEELQSKDRKLATDLFQSFLKVHPESRYRPDVLFYLSDLYYDMADYEYRRAMEEYDQKLSAGVITSPPKPNYSKAIAIYRKFIEKFPNSKYIDTVIYNLGYCLNEEGKHKEAIEVFRKLAEKYPRSPYTPEAYLRIGEYYFDLYKWDLAIENYKKVLPFWESSYYDKALYKLAWSYYRKGDFNSAISNFVALVEDSYALSKEEAEIIMASSIDLRDEALAYIAICFAEFATPEKAKEFFVSLGPRPYRSEAFKRMGEVYENQEKYPEAVRIYKCLLELEPLYKEAPQISQRIVKCLEQTKQRDAAMKAREELARRFSPDSSWFQKHQGEKEVITHVSQMRSKTVKTVALYYHAQAQEEKRSEAYSQAIRWYRDWLKNYQSDTEEAQEINYYLAECLYNLGKYAAASEEYVKVSKYTPLKYKETAAYNAIVSAQKHYEITPSPEALSKFAEACKNYEKLFPKGEKVPEVLYQLATIYYQTKEYEKAQLVYQKIITAFPKHSKAIEARRWLAKSAYEQSDFLAAEKWYRSLYQVASEEELKKEAEIGMAQSAFKRAEAQEKQGNLKTSAVIYQYVAKEYPNYEYADKSLFNAALNYEKAGDIKQSALCYEKIGRQFSQSPQAAAALFNAALAREETGEYQKALENYKLLVKKYPEAEMVSDAMYNMGLLYEKEEDFAKAAETFEALFDKFPDKKDAKDTLYKAILCYRKLKNWQALIKVIKKFIAHYQATAGIIGFLAQIGEEWFQKGSKKEALQLFKFALDAQKELNDAEREKVLLPIAKMKFWIAEESYDKFTSQPLTLPLKESLLKKVKLCKEAIKKYGECAQVGAPEWTTRAIYKMGKSWETLYEELLRTPKPPELTEVETQEYQLSLKKQSLEYRHLALEAYRKNLQFGVKNDWTKKSEERLESIVESFYTIGRDYINYAEELIARRPQGVSPEKLVELKIGYFLKAIQIYDEALEIFQANIPKLTKVGISEKMFQKFNLAQPEITYRKGKAYAALAQFLLTAPPPPGLTSEELFEYTLQVRNQVVENERKGIAFHQKILKEGENEWVKRSREEIVAALYRIGDVYERNVDLIKNYQPPQNLTLEELQVLNFQLEEEMLQNEEKAIKWYEYGFEYAQQEKINTKWVEAIKTRLSILKIPESILSNSSWKCRNFLEDNWKEAAFDDLDWETPRVILSKVPPVANLEKTSAQAIWDKSGSEIVYFRKVFHLYKLPSSRGLAIFSEGPYELFINTRLVGKRDEPLSGEKKADVYDITSFLKEGKNCIAVKVVYTPGSSGLVVDATLEGAPSSGTKTKIKVEEIKKEEVSLKEEKRKKIEEAVSVKEIEEEGISLKEKETEVSVNYEYEEKENPKAESKKKEKTSVTVAEITQSKGGVFSKLFLGVGVICGIVSLVCYSNNNVTLGTISLGATGLSLIIAALSNSSEEVLTSDAE